MKKIFTLTFALMLAAVLAVTAFAAEKTVYLSAGGDDANDGAAYTSAVKSLDKAYELIGVDDGRIVVCSYINVGGDYVLPKHDGKVTFTATDGKFFYPLGKLAFSGALTLSGETVFDRVQLSASGTSFLAAAGNNLTLGKDVEVAGNLVLLAGYNVTDASTAESVSFSNDVTVNVLGGDYLYFRGGNRRATGTAPFGKISGNVTFNIAGGSFTARDSSANLNAATGMNEHSGDVCVNITGGCFYGSVYAVGRAGTSSLESKPVVSGDVTINVGGGSLNGKNICETQDTSMKFDGRYSLNLLGGSFNLVENIEGSAAAKLTVAESLKTGKGTTVSDFKNPLREGADPWVIYKDGYYYMTTVAGVTINCFKSATLDGLAFAQPVAIWTAPQGSAINSENKMYSADIWSPELHYVEESEFGKEYAGWWLYFAADDGNNENHRLYAVKALTDDACGRYGSPVTKEYNVPVKMVVDNDKMWAIGQSLLRANGKTYLTWTSEIGRGTAEFYQQIRIAELENPYTIKGGVGYEICMSDYAWETKGYAYNASTGASYPKVVEGATAVYGDNGEIMIIYSASGYWTNYYCLGTLTLKSGADPLKKASWVKAEEPVFTHQNGVFGPGHAAYTVDAEGNRWMMYHAYLNFARTGGRYVFIQPWTLDGTTVDMNGGPYSQDTILSIVNNQKSITDAIKGFGN